MPISARQGFAKEQAIYRQLSEKGIPVISALSAVVMNLQTSGAGRPLLITQYTSDVNDRLVSYFADAGIECLHAAGLGRKNAQEVNATLPDDYYRLAKAIVADRPAADSVFLSARCNLRDVALRLEAETGIRIVYQDQAALWWALRIFSSL